MPADDTLRARRSRIREGGAPKYQPRTPSRGSSSPASASTGCSTRARSSRTAARQRRRRGAARRRRGHRPRADRRPHRRRHGQRLDGEGRQLGRAHRREDPPHPGDRRAPCACPLFYLVDSAGARITDQIEMFPGRRGAGRIFYNQVRLSGEVPQVCLLFGPSAAGGAYIPAFCDVVVMVEGNASMYLGSPRMAEMVIGEKVTLEEMGGARMHCSVSGCGDVLVKTEEEAIAAAQRVPRATCRRASPSCRRVGRGAGPDALGQAHRRDHPRRPEQALRHVRAHRRARRRGQLLRGEEALRPGARSPASARIDGRPVGIVANQPKYKGGVLFVDSADKAARFIWLCDAFNIPLLYLADVPGLHDRHQGRARRHHPRRARR